VLGEGGMGIVYKALQPAFGRTVAVKAMHRHLYLDADAVHRFMREARILALLDHSNIVRTFSLGSTADQRPFIIMEYLEGETLAAILAREKTLAPEQFQRIFSEILEGLSYAHSRGLMHRDLKPANIMVTRNGATKIMDFGIAKSLNPDAQSLTATGDLVGSPQYMSPERASTSKEIGIGSDLYSVACMMYEALEGKPLFEADSPVEMLLMHINEAPRAVANASAGMADLIAKALQKNPADRQGSADEMRAELISAAADRTPNKGTPGQPKQAKRRQQKKSWIGLGGIAGLAAIVAVGAFAWLQCTRQIDTAADIKSEQTPTVLLKEANVLTQQLYTGTAGQRQQFYEASIDKINQAAKLTEKNPAYRSARLAVLEHYADLYYAHGDYSLAIDCRQRILEQLPKTDLNGRADTLGAIGSAETGAGHYAQAEKYFDESLKLKRQHLDGLPDEHMSMWGDFEQQITLYTAWNKPDRCLAAAKRLYELAKQYGTEDAPLFIPQMYYGYYLVLASRAQEGMPLLVGAVELSRQRCRERGDELSLKQFAEALNDLSKARAHVHDLDGATRAQNLRTQILESLQKGSLMDVSKVLI
jgi:serine/threonine protein kinase